MFLTFTARARILGITDHKSEPMCKSYNFTSQKKKSMYFLLFRQNLTFLLRDWNERVRK